jgi:transposase
VAAFLPRSMRLVMRSAPLPFNGGGEASDCTQALALLDGMAAKAILADTGYDADDVVKAAEFMGAEVVIASKNPRYFDKVLYRELNFIERVFFNKSLVSIVKNRAQEREDSPVLGMFFSEQCREQHKLVSANKMAIPYTCLNSSIMVFPILVFMTPILFKRSVEQIAVSDVPFVSWGVKHHDFLLSVIKKEKIHFYGGGYIDRCCPIIPFTFVVNSTFIFCKFHPNFFKKSLPNVFDFFSPS